MSQERSFYEWRNPRGSINTGLEKVEGLALNLVARKGMLTTSAKRDLYERGAVGRAQVLDAPGQRPDAQATEPMGRFHARVELPGEAPYEVKLWQSYSGAEWDLLRPGAVVECRVDPKNRKRVLLCAPEPDSQISRVEDSSQLLATGRRAVGRVLDSSKFDMTVPGTADPVYVLVLEVRADDEPESWTVRYGQRVPAVAEEMVEPGRELQVAFSATHDDEAVAVDWPATTGGRLS